MPAREFEGVKRSVAPKMNKKKKKEKKIRRKDGWPSDVVVV